MSRLAYPLNRGMDADAGGAAELQTDVMRFMAIISLCLVAIFALVQSMPLAPETVETRAEEREPAPEAPAPTTEPDPQPAPDPSPVGTERTPPSKLAGTIDSPAEPAATDLETPQVPEPPVPEPPVPEPQVGFTLAFADDSALTVLVAQKRVGLFAIAADQSVQLGVRHGQLRFADAPAPHRMHEMDVRTVPPAVLNALRQSGKLPPAAVRWGVTLPAALSVQLDRLLGQHSGGNLIIDADGTIRIGS